MTHLSASHRKIQLLEHRVAELEQMQMEYNLLLNYLVEYHSEPAEVIKTFIIDSDQMKTIKPGPIVTEITPDGKRMEIRRVPGTNGHSRPLIVAP